MNLEPFKNCAALKHGVYISPDFTSPYKPCCWFKETLSADSYEEYRQNLDKVDIEKACDFCITREKNGASRSHRHGFFNFQKVIGISFDNICNYKCTTCSPFASSQWIKDYSILYPNSNEFLRKAAQQQFLAPKKLEFVKNYLQVGNYSSYRIELYGGEPLLSPTVMEFFDWLIQQPYANRVHMVFATNGSTFNLQKMESILKHLDKVNIGFSIDGYKEGFEYLRYLGKWDNVHNNIVSFSKLQNIFINRLNLTFNYTLSWMNSLHFADFYNYLNDNWAYEVAGITTLQEPTYYSINCLPYSIREKILKTATARMNNPKSDEMEKLYNLYKETMLLYKDEIFNSELLSNGCDMLSKLDVIRNTDYKKTFADFFTLLQENNISI